MMIAKMNAEGGKQFLLLGLSRVNLNRLLAGDPIQITRESHGEAIPAGLTIAIMFGETELDMKKDLEKYGVVGKDTKITVDPRLG